MTETLSTFALKKAIKSLGKALAQPKNEFTRDACIQRFEYSFELTWKFLKRYLTEKTGFTEFNIKNIFREAARQNLINNPESWFKYLEARNLTFHTYDEDTAEETYDEAKLFYEEAILLLPQLEKLTNE